MSFAAWLISAGAHAAEPPGFRCGESDRPWVELQFEGAGWDPKLERSIRADLAAGLRLRGLLVCTPDKPGSEAPLASVQLSAAAMERVAVEIEVHDALTNKYVLREVDMLNVPNDARGLTLAAAAEELLRASWAELALEDAPPPAREPPVEVKNAVRSVNPVPRDEHALGVRFSAEHFTGGQTLLGADAWFDIWMNQQVAIELAIGYRHGLDETAEHGTISSQAAVFGSDVLVAFAPRSAQLLLGARLGVQLGAYEFDGKASETGVGSQHGGLGVLARAALLMRLRLGELAEFRLEGGPGVSLRAIAVYDDETEVTGTRGLQAHGEIGFGVLF